MQGVRRERREKDPSERAGVSRKSISKTGGLSMSLTWKNKEDPPGCPPNDTKMDIIPSDPVIPLLQIYPVKY